ncbi:hypothetical protein V6Z11_D03G105200 [Gossypium hirsutum]
MLLKQGRLHLTPILIPLRIFRENSRLLLCFTLLGGCGLGIENRDKRNGEGKQASSCFSIAICLHRRCAHQSRHCRKAVVNEDASGDVVAMRLQIQQLKKEVSRLRAFVNGKSENLDNEIGTCCCTA